MSAVEYLGCFLILVAVVIAQLDFSKFGKKKNAVQAVGNLQSDNATNNTETIENTADTDENKD